MASAVIHMVVASEINKKLKRDNDKILLGSIAPDISKHIGETKLYSHFLDETNKEDIPNIKKFLSKYGNKLDDDFVLGYFIHLYTDFLWFKYFIPEIYNKNMIRKLDGTIIKCNPTTLKMYIYNDYSNLNSELLEEYNMDVQVLYNQLPIIDDIIKEIPMDKLQIIVDQTLIIIENSKIHKDFVFDMKNIRTFINTCILLTVSKLKDFEIN